jgi:hypothetical protein
LSFAICYCINAHDGATRLELLEPHACGVVAFVGTVACFLLCKVPFILCYSGLLIRVQNGSLDEKSETNPYVSTNFPACLDGRVGDWISRTTVATEW